MAILTYQTVRAGNAWVIPVTHTFSGRTLYPYGRKTESYHESNNVSGWGYSESKTSSSSSYSVIMEHYTPPNSDGDGAAYSSSSSSNSYSESGKTFTSAVGTGSTTSSTSDGSYHEEWHDSWAVYPTSSATSDVTSGSAGTTTDAVYSGGTSGSSDVSFSYHPVSTTTLSFEDISTETSFGRTTADGMFLHSLDWRQALESSVSYGSTYASYTLNFGGPGLTFTTHSFSEATTVSTTGTTSSRTSTTTCNSTWIFYSSPQLILRQFTINTDETYEGVPVTRTVWGTTEGATQSSLGVAVYDTVVSASSDSGFSIPYGLPSAPFTGDKSLVDYRSSVTTTQSLVISQTTVVLRSREMATKADTSPVTGLTRTAETTGERTITLTESATVTGTTERTLTSWDVGVIPNTSFTTTSFDYLTDFYTAITQATFVSTFSAQATVSITVPLVSSVTRSFSFLDSTYTAQLGLSTYGTTTSSKALSLVNPAGHYGGEEVAMLTRSTYEGSYSSFTWEGSATVSDFDAFFGNLLIIDKVYDDIHVAMPVAIPKRRDEGAVAPATHYEYSHAAVTGNFGTSFYQIPIAEITPGVMTPIPFPSTTFVQRSHGTDFQSFAETECPSFTVSMNKDSLTWQKAWSVANTSSSSPQYILTTTSSSGVLENAGIVPVVASWASGGFDNNALIEYINIGDGPVWARDYRVLGGTTQGSSLATMLLKGGLWETFINRPTTIDTSFSLVPLWESVVISASNDISVRRHVGQGYLTSKSGDYHQNYYSTSFPA